MHIFTTTRAFRSVCVGLFLAASITTSAPSAGASAEHVLHSSQPPFELTWPDSLQLAQERTAAFGEWVGGLRYNAMLAEVARQWQVRQVAPPPTRATVVVPTPPAPPPVVAAASIASVLQCIRDHESGNYASNTHAPDGASGAYQYIGSTWRHWSVAAGYPGYEHAWQAPPAVQDAVTAFTLTHGGAGNWSPRFGNDPCTVGMGG